MGSCPLDELHSATGDQPFDLACPAEERVQIEGRTIGWIFAMRNVDAPARLISEHPEEVRRPLAIVWSVRHPYRFTNDVKVPVLRNRRRR